jgi:hypothetical protein
VNQGASRDPSAFRDDPFDEHGLTVVFVEVLAYCRSAPADEAPPADHQRRRHCYRGDVALVVNTAPGGGKL